MLVKKDGYCYIEDYTCDVCHRPNVLQKSCYKIEIGGAEKAACEFCQREILKGENNDQEKGSQN